MKQVAKFMEGKTVHFNGAGDSKLPTIEQSWNVDFMSFGDETGEAKRAMNLTVLDGVAEDEGHGRRPRALGEQFRRYHPGYGARAHGEEDDVEQGGNYRQPPDPRY